MYLTQLIKALIYMPLTTNWPMKIGLLHEKFQTDEKYQQTSHYFFFYFLTVF